MKKIIDNLGVGMFAGDIDIMTVCEHKNYTTFETEIVATYGMESMPPIKTVIVKDYKELESLCRDHEPDLRKWKSCEVANR